MKKTHKKYINSKSNLIKYNNCKNNNNIINLNDVNIIEKNNKHFLIYKKKNNIFNTNKYIDEGSYGSIYAFITKNKEKVAVKFFNSNKDNEIKILKKLEKKKIPCNIINSKLFKIDNNYINVMNLMDGTLSNLNGKFNKLGYNNINKIIKNLAINLNCLNNNNLSYTDIKSSNILYKCMDDNYIYIVLGDIGSICIKGMKNTCTWLPWENRFNNGYTSCNEKSMIWQLGILILELLNINITPFYWDNIYKYNVDEFFKIINKILNLKKINKLNKDIIDILPNMLELNPKKRITFKNIIKKIN